MGKLSRKAATKPKTGWRYQRNDHNMADMRRTSIIPFTFFHEECDFVIGHFLGFEVREMKIMRRPDGLEPARDQGTDKRV